MKECRKSWLYEGFASAVLPIIASLIRTYLQTGMYMVEVFISVPMGGSFPFHQ